MQLTKTLEAEILQHYNTFWEANLGGQMENFASYLDDDFSIFGSANGEVFFNKTDAVEFYAATVDQLAGKAVFRNRNQSIQPLDENTVIVRELLDLYVLIESEWTYYGNARITCIMRYTGGSWKAVHQHSSFPDHRTEEGQQIATEKIEKENLELREAVKRRTIELENKTRELEIEASLEKVRAEALGMKKPEDLMAVCEVVYQELLALGFKELRNAMINVYEDDKPFFLNYDYAPGSGKTVTRMPYGIHPLIDKQVRETKNTGDALNEFSFSGKELNAFRELRKNNGEQDDPKLDNSSSLHYYFYSIGTGSIGISTYSGIHADKLVLLKRFRNVFDFAYRRYMDVAQAEAQAREAQIEVAVERVRARSMAMHQTVDLDKVNKELLHQLQWLNVQGLTGVSIILIDEDELVSVWDLSSPGNMGIPDSFTSQYDPRKYPVLGEPFHLLKQSQDYFTLYYPLEKLKNGLEEWREIDKNIADNFDTAIKNGSLKQQWKAFARLSNGLLSIDLMNPPSDDTRTIVLKMAGAFNLAYKRFLDLQKAEAQAREAQIQLALERVRARTMAMQASDELPETSHILFEQMKELGEPVEQLTIGIVQEENNAIEISATLHGDTLKKMYLHSIDEPYMMNKVYKAWKTEQKTLIVELKGDELNSYNKYRNKLTNSEMFPTNLGDEHRRIVYAAFFSKGMLALGANEPRPLQSLQLLERFASVFDLTYTRFLDLQKAEAQAREAKIEAALERVRSRTLAMRKSDELAETAAVLFQQLIALGIEPNRLYIAILKDDQGESEFWITEEDGTKVSTAFAADLNKNESFIKMFAGWKLQKRSLVLDMQGEELQNYFRHLTSLGVPFKGGLEQKRRVQDIAYFSKGFIGMASPDKQPAETLLLLERFAAVFNLTFTRFNDLKIAEAHATQAEQDLIAIKEAKQKAEEALTELQATQKQLIQSEKMASLGELTAGIAHEIQNPLNFVNNFSEVNRDLLAEMKDEIRKGNLSEANAIADDVISNEEKINHHGKRADTIVKGMLQHSRTSGLIKEPADINKLADEYLRLAYHGMRAKDNAFNTTLQTDFDESIGNVNIIPQDIGRVILNIINNAFHAVHARSSAFTKASAGKSAKANAVDEKKKSGIEYYEPTVAISTKKQSGNVLISIKDNGNGIPQNLIDKIFQPFFTTKPTGQGTGLGLSLSYDIVKAHGGEINVESKEGEGSEFVIQLPMN